MTDSSLTVYLKDYKAPPFFIDTIDLEFDLNEEITTVKSHLTMHRNPQSVLVPNLELDGESLELESILLNNVKLQTSDYQILPSRLVIYNVPDKFELIVTTLLKPQENTALTGLYKSSGNYCTQCESHGFRRITYFLDRPDVMSQYTTKIIADKKRYPILLSNGNLVESGETVVGRHWAKWVDPFKKPSYLFALVAGNLVFIEDFFITSSGRRVKLVIYVEQGNQDKCAHAMEAVKKAMRWDEVRFGREYDLDIYMIVAVSDFNMGAMENKGLNIFNTQYILGRPETATDEDFIHIESVIAHEYFHNWSGNRVTCRDWFQLSLKEGLTIFRDQSFTEDTTSKTVARIHAVNELRTRQFPEDSSPLAHPVRPDSYIEINNFYTSTVYNKGAEVIRMIQTILGDKLFRAGMDLYFERHDGYAVTIEDFVSAMEDASKIDLTQFRLWYSQAGTPVVDVTDGYDPNTKKYQLSFTQSCPVTPGQNKKLPFYIPIKMGLLTAEGKEIKLENTSDILHLKKSVEVFEFANIESKPIPSLLRGFSAPIKINYSYSDDDLVMLFKFDSDPFNRWEAGQRYAINLALRLMDSFQTKNSIVIPDQFTDAFRYVVEHYQSDKLLLAEMLTLPSEKYLADQVSPVNVESVHRVREQMLLEIARDNAELLLKVYRENHQKEAYQFNMAEIGKRQFKNRCLAYLTLLEDDASFVQLAMQQFKDSLSNNMTDTIAALRCLSNSNTDEREDALHAFYLHWKHDALVVDKWFSLQATSKLPGTLQRVKKLFYHEAFDIKNPNKVYALVGAFGNNNLYHFHDASGEGYIFIADVVEQLNELNPQVAARMIKPLINWKRYDRHRQKLMVEQLERIVRHKNLSKDIYEIVSKSLLNEATIC